MTLQQWINDVDDRFIEVGGSPAAINQCTDLVNDFIIRVLGKEPIFGTNAIDFCSRADDSYQRISPDNYPQAGDIVILNMGSYGHIVVATGIINGTKFQSMSQNYPLKDRANLDDFSLSKVKCILRKETMPTNDAIIKQLAQCQTDLTACKKNYDALLAKELKWKAQAGACQVKLDAMSTTMSTKIKELEAEQIKLMKEQDIAITRISEACEKRLGQQIEKDKKICEDQIKNSIGKKCPICKPLPQTKAEALAYLIKLPWKVKI